MGERHAFSRARLLRPSAANRRTATYTLCLVASRRISAISGQRLIDINYIPPYSVGPTLVPPTLFLWREIMRKTILALAATLALSAPASAGTIYDLFATSLFKPALGDFSIRFDDVSGDGRLQIGEITNFSGLSIESFPFFFSQVTCVPDLSGIATTSGCGNGTFWQFGPGTFQITTTPFDYVLTPVSAVPLPPAIFLLAAAFGGLGLLRWWRTRRTRIELITA